MPAQIPYSYRHSLAADKTFMSRFKQQDTSALTLKQHYDGFRKFYLILRDNTTGKDVAIDMDEYRTSLYASPWTIGEWLENNDNAALTHMAAIPRIRTRKVKYGDAYRQGYQAWLTAPGVPVGNSVPTDQLTELVLTRPDTDYYNFNINALISINGYFHWYSTDTKGIYVKDAGKSLKVAKTNQVGIYSFRGIGGVSRYAMNRLTFRPVLEGLPLSEGVVFDIPASYTNNRYVMFSIGGYLIPTTGGVIQQVGDYTFRFNIDKFNWPDRFFEMAKSLDLSSFNLKVDKFNPHLVETSQLYSDAVIKALLTMSQSFVISLNTTNFFFERHPLDISKVVGVYRTRQFEQLPLQIGHGRMAEYWTEVDRGDDHDPLVGLFVADGILHERAYDYGQIEGRVAMDEKRVPEQRSRIADAWFIHMGRDF